MRGGIHYVIYPERGMGRYRRATTNDLYKIIRAYGKVSSRIYVYDEYTHEAYCILYFGGVEVLRIPITESQFLKL